MRIFTGILAILMMVILGFNLVGVISIYENTVWNTFLMVVFIGGLIYMEVNM